MKQASNIRKCICKTTGCRIALSLFWAASALQAEDYTINWFTIDGGGGASTGGGYSLSGTIGQPDAGKMTGGGYTLDGGFWGLVATYPPLLKISSAGGFVTICWPSPSSGYVLEETDSLANPTWTEVAQAPTDDGLSKCVTVSALPDQKYFRLKKP